jgi:hypothetical protein
MLMKLRKPLAIQFAALIDFRISNAIYCGRPEGRCPHETAWFAKDVGAETSSCCGAAEAAAFAA